MKVFNSVKAYEEVGLFDGGNFVRTERVEHETYAGRGHATEEGCRSALVTIMAHVFSAVLAKGGNALMFNRMGPFVEQGEDGFWSYRWRVGFLNFEEPEFTIATEQRYPA